MCFLIHPWQFLQRKFFAWHPECYNTEALNLFNEGKDSFVFPRLHFTRETIESMAINQVSSIVFVDFAVQGTLSRRIFDGAKIGNPKTTYLVHGEEKSMKSFAAKIQAADVKIPTLHETIEL